MKNFIIILSSLLLIGLSNGVFAQGTPMVRCVDGYNPITGEKCSNAVTSAVPFLRIVSDARGGAMGDAGIATTADPNSLHYNPSKLAFADKDFAFSATYTPWMKALGLQDVYLAYLTGYKKIDKLQTVGFSLRYFSLGNIDFTDDQGQSLGSGNPNEFEFSLAYSRKLSDKFSAGIAGKYIFSNLASGQRVAGVDIKSGHAGAADISVSYRSNAKLGGYKGVIAAGMAISNIGSKITYTNSINKEFIPANLGLGAAYTMKFDQYNEITLTTDFNKLLVPTPDLTAADLDPNDGVPDYKQVSGIKGILNSFSDAPGGFSEELKEITTSIGVEYWYDQQFAVRAGFFREHYSKGNRKYATVGLGLKYNVFGINFSYLVPTTNQRNPLDNTLRFSLLFDFGALSADGAEPID